jgi:RNA polymerase sigma-B factor
MGAEDPDLASVVDLNAVRPLIGRLPKRERTILILRYFGNQPQTQIAEHVGISQMHVSRLLSRSLNRLRTELLADPDPLAS